MSAARNLAAADAGFFSATKSSDPYVTLAYRGRVNLKKKTAVAKRTLTGLQAAQNFLVTLVTFAITS